MIHSVRFSSPAKINLGLRITGLRPDGYHSIESVFVAVNLVDTITITLSETLLVHCTPPVTGTPEENLVFKAASAFFRTAGIAYGAKIHLEKCIPTGAGLGGGSGNAATTLASLNTLHGSPLPDSELQMLAENLGSDVPFFLHSSPAFVSGKGEIVTPLYLNLPWHIVVVKPEIHISTAAAYALIDQRTQMPRYSETLPDILSKIVNIQALTYDLFNEVAGRNLTNEFHDVIGREYPVVHMISTRLLSSGAIHASLSGSGSAVYGLFATEAEARSASARLPDFNTYICQPLTTSQR